MKPTHPVGARGEADAERYLSARGLTMVERRYRTPLGEIDLIARDRDAWIFIEVKTRPARRPGSPSGLDAITPAKQKRLVRSALIFMKQRRLHNAAMRFDVVAIEGDRIEWIPNAFEPTSFYTY